MIEKFYRLKIEDKLKPGLEILTFFIIETETEIQFDPVETIIDMTRPKLTFDL